MKPKKRQPRAKQRPKAKRAKHVTPPELGEVRNLLPLARPGVISAQIEEPGSSQQTLKSGGGQAGDSQGLREVEDVTSESVKELAEEGQGLEATLVEAVERAPDADQSEVTIHKTPEKSGSLEFKNRNRL